MNSHTALSNVFAKVVGRASQAKEAIGANAAEPSALSKILPHVLQTQHIFFPFRSIHAPSMHGLRIGL